MMRSFSMLSALTLIAGCSTAPMGAAAPVAEAARAQDAPSSADYVRMAAVSDQYEIQSSRLVLETTQDEALRRFAGMMVEHHTGTTAALQAAAQSDGLSPPAAALDPAKAQMIRELRAAAGPARDTLYRTQQVMAHREALDLHARYEPNGPDGALRANAKAAVPIISRHYNLITNMAVPRP